MLVLVTGTVNLADILTKAQALAVFTTLMQAFDVLRTFLGEVSPDSGEPADLVACWVRSAPAHVSSLACEWPDPSSGG